MLFRSPYTNGVVEEIFTAEGEKVTAGTKCLSIIDNSTLEVVGYVPEEFIKDISEDDPVEIRPVADPTRVFSGKVVAVASMAVEQNNETVVPVILSIGEATVPENGRADETSGFLLPNFNVDITFNPDNQSADSSGRERLKGAGSK